jgi:uncharacterized RDD family membrane protein YckC
MQPDNTNNMPIQNQPIQSTPAIQTAQVVQQIPAAQSQNQIVYAGFGSRFIASSIDGLVSYVIIFIVGFIFGIIIVISKINSPLLPSSVKFLANLLAMTYFIYFTGSKGQTFGKMIMKIKVVSVGSGIAPGYWHAFLREFVGKLISALVLFLGFFWMLWDPQKQTWHDKIAGTVVVKV